MRAKQVAIASLLAGAAVVGIAALRGGPPAEPEAGVEIAAASSEDAAAADQDALPAGAEATASIDELTAMLAERGRQVGRWPVGRARPSGTHRDHPPSRSA